MRYYPDNMEQKIDFTVIREELNRRCSSPLGRERVEAIVTTYHRLP